MAALKFNVQGSMPEPYVVTFYSDDRGPYATCTCAAGHAQQVCKHRIALIDGDAGAVVEGAPAELEALAAMLDGSEMQAALRRLAKAEREADAAKRKVAAEKKALARIMHR